MKESGLNDNFFIAMDTKNRADILLRLKKKNKPFNMENVISLLLIIKYISV